MRIIIGIILLTLAVACHRGTQGVSSDVKLPGDTSADLKGPSTDQFLLLSFELVRDTTVRAGERCIFVKSEAFKGQIKKGLSEPATLRSGDLVCQFYNTSGQLIQTIVQADPLTEPIEVFHETGTMNRHEVPWNTSELVLRIQQTPDLQQLIIGKVMSNQTIITLFTLQL